MIKVFYSTNLKRGEDIVNGSTTLRQFMEEHDVDYTTGGVMLDGSTLRPGDLDRSFTDFGITEKASLLKILKADNA